MDLILWRHADAIAAEDGDEFGRELSGKGRKQAAQMAAWLEQRLPDAARIYCGESRRDVETGEYLANLSAKRLHVKPRLGMHATVDDMLAVADWPNNRHPVVLVGHQPALGQLVSTLLVGAKGTLAIRKGAVCWLTNRRRAEEAELTEAQTVVMRAFISPDLV